MIRLFASAAFAASFVLPVAAHSTFVVDEAKTGQSFRAALAVPHGCGDLPTRAVRIEIPEGFYSVKPMPKAGWSLETVTGPYENTYSNHGRDVSEGVTEIIWSRGELPTDFYDEFVFVGTFAESLEPGPIYFPAVQECEGAEEAWVDLDGGAMPAPSVTLTAGSGDGHDHHATAPAGETSVGDLVLSGAFTRATLPNAPVAGGYLTIANNGAEDDRLVSANAGIARETQIHEMAMEGDVMKMRQLPDGVVIPAGESVTLAPGGVHLMFMGIEGAVAEGDVVPLTLTFEKSGTVEIELTAAGTAADAPAEDHSGHMGH